jgi:hypothetical protein
MRLLILPFGAGMHIGILAELDHLKKDHEKSSKKNFLIPHFELL